MFFSDTQVIGARHLPKPGRSIASPFVEIELVAKQRTTNSRLLFAVRQYFFCITEILFSI